MYTSPDNEAGNFEPRHLVEPIQRQHHQIHDHIDNLDDDQQKLLDIEQNIANLEKNLIHGNVPFDITNIYWCCSQANICTIPFHQRQIVSTDLFHVQFLCVWSNWLTITIFSIQLFEQIRSRVTVVNRVAAESETYWSASCLHLIVQIPLKLATRNILIRQWEMLNQ